VTRRAFAPGRFRLLLLALLVLIVGTAAVPRSGPAEIVNVILIAATLGIGVVELRAPGQPRLVPVTLAVCVILVTAMDYAVSLRHLPLISSGGVAAISGIVIWIAYGAVMRPHRPVGDRIVGAICVFLLIGLGWASVYEMLDRAVPGSFRYPADSAWTTPSAFRYRYFSFVTLATLGYGDITPVTALAGTLASLEAIAGQLYIGITVARLVALSLTDHADPRQRSKL
jgi:voltage-gated potassium channel